MHIFIKDVVTSIDTEVCTQYSIIRVAYLQWRWPFTPARLSAIIYRSHLRPSSHSGGTEARVFRCSVRSLEGRQSRDVICPPTLARGFEHGSRLKGRAGVAWLYWPTALCLWQSSTASKLIADITYSNVWKGNKLKGIYFALFCANWSQSSTRVVNVVVLMLDTKTRLNYFRFKTDLSPGSTVEFTWSDISVKKPVSRLEGFVVWSAYKFQ